MGPFAKGQSRWFAAMTNAPLKANDQTSWVPGNVHGSRNKPVAARLTATPLAVAGENSFRASNGMLPFRCSTGCYNRSRNRLRPSVRTCASGAIVLIASCSAARFS